MRQPQHLRQVRERGLAAVGLPVGVGDERDGGVPGGVVACGDIGGNLTDTGALVIVLQTQATGAIAGVAVLAPALEDPGATGVSVFLIAGLPATGAAATPILSVD